MTIEELQEQFWKKWQETPEEEKLFWIRENLPYLLKGVIQKEDGLHILDGIESMVASLCGKHSGGDFVEAVLNNDLMGALDTADATNEIVLRTYMLFLYNKVPMTLRRK